MRKQTKIAAGISAAALVAVAGAMTSLAATGWVNEGGSWYYYNTSGDYVTDTWKAYNGQYFYLGDDGEMWTSRLVEDGDDHYYVDANGAMVKNTWVAVPTDDDDDYDVDYRWYYFGSTGKAYKNSNGKTINGKKYGFDTDGKMLFGYVDSNKNILNDEDEPILNAVYYYGTNEDGARHTGWLQYTDALSSVDDAEDKTYDYYWFYFKSNGVKVENANKTINGKKYTFGDHGVMQYEWSTGNVATDEKNTPTRWYGSLEDGSLAKNKWIWSKPYDSDVRSYELKSTQDDYDSDTNRWFRTDASGNLVTDTTKKINGKWYVFDQDGVMKTGLISLQTADNDDAKGAVSSAKIKTDYDMDTITAEKLVDAADGKNVHYFSEDEEKDGSMKTGTIKIELADDEYTFCFNKNTGAAKHGYDSKKLYNCGILLKAGDDKYKVFQNPDTTSDGKSTIYLVGSSGSILTVAEGKYAKYKDANDMYYVITRSGEQYTIYKTYNETDAKNAVNNPTEENLNKLTQFKEDGSDAEIV